jgi:acetyl-CoA carboxylase, biotin carboxylase subunit
LFKKVLVANRGEIALRIVRACKELNIPCVMVHSEADSESMAVRLADESVCIGPSPAKNSYLNIPNVLAAAEISGADAIHPGFGFLSENASFAKMVEEHGIKFIGPSYQHIETMGDKIKAKQTAVSLGLKTVPGSTGEVESEEHLYALAEEIGFPILIKATAGGGGKGMRVVRSEQTLLEDFSMAQSEALANFGYGGVYVEKYLDKPRHIEVQILGDSFGNVICLGERDCSVQRRHQKIWEEAPSCALSNEERATFMQQCQQAMRKFGYVNAGTLEFLYEKGEFYFIEMNTRIQVEHPITEMITGVDIVQQQILIAAGHPLDIRQEDLLLRGHAIECRINAEHPETFFPSPGTVLNYIPPGGPFVRVDSALFPGCVISPYYDSLGAKLVVYGATREQALSRMRRALTEYVISGVQTLIPLHLKLCNDPDMIKGDYDIKWLEQVFFAKEKGEK